MVPEPQGKKTIIAAGRSIKVRIEEMEAEAWDAMDQGFVVAIPPEMAPVMGLDDEVTHEEFVDGILSDRMWAEEEGARIPAS